MHSSKSGKYTSLKAIAFKHHDLELYKRNEGIYARKLKNDERHLCIFPGTENSKYDNTNDAVTPKANYVELKIRSVYMMRLKKIGTKG